MTKKKPDQVVDNPGIMPYTTNVGAPAIRKDDVDLWKQQGVAKVNHQFKTRFEELKKQYDVIVIVGLSDYDGRLVLVSDPGLFINDNWPRLDNSEFMLDMLHALLPHGGEVVFDESRHISDNTFENARRTFYSGAITFTSTIWSIFVVVVLIISFTIVTGIVLKPQRVWYNENLLGSKYFNILNYPYITSYDYWQIYNTFLEKVRLGYGFTPEEFKDLDEGTLFNLINDDYLWRFVTQQFPSYAESDYYYFIINRMASWSPRAPGEVNGKPAVTEPWFSGDGPIEVEPLDPEAAHETDAHAAHDDLTRDPGFYRHGSTGSTSSTSTGGPGDVD